MQKEKRPSPVFVIFYACVNRRAKRVVAALSLCAHAREIKLCNYSWCTLKMVGETNVNTVRRRIVPHMQKDSHLGWFFQSSETGGRVMAAVMHSLNGRLRQSDVRALRLSPGEKGLIFGVPLVELEMNFT